MKQTLTKSSPTKRREEKKKGASAAAPLAAAVLAGGGVGVLPTDTIYGIVGSALAPKTVERIYRLRRRNKKKPVIVLIESLDDLKKFGVALTSKERALTKRLWPGKVSIILPCRSAKFAYLHRGTKTLAFRMPKPRWLRALLAETGPLVAPSANIEGEPPAKTVAKARRYFGTKIEFYGDAGTIASAPSTLVALKNGALTVLRQGAVNVGDRR